MEGQRDGGTLDHANAASAEQIADDEERRMRRYTINCTSMARLTCAWESLCVLISTLSRNQAPYAGSYPGVS